MLCLALKALCTDYFDTRMDDIFILPTFKILHLQ